MKKILLFVLLLNILDSHGQTFFSKTIGDSINHVWITKTIGTSDGGYLLCGRVNQYNHPSSKQAILLKLDSQGDTSWTSVLSDTTSVFYSAVELPSQQGFICVGGDIICLIDTSGNLIWRKDGYLGSLTHIMISDSTLLLGTFEGGTLIKTDFNGNIIWEMAINLSSIMGKRADILQSSGGEIYVAGGTIDIQGTTPALYKIDGNGNLIWAHSYSLNNPDIDGSFISIDTTFDGKLLLVARYGDHFYTWNNIEYTKIDTDGTVIWTRFLPNWSPYESDGIIFPVSQSTYGLIGYSEYGTRTFSLTMDTSGIPIETKLFPMVGGGYEMNVSRLINHRLLLSSTVDNNEASKIYLLDSTGRSYCGMIDTAVIVVDTTPVYALTINPVVTFFTGNIYNTTDSIIRGIPFLSDCFLTHAEDPENENLQTEIIIFPNPATVQFVVESSEFVENTTLEIFNLLGEKIYSAAYRGPLTVDCEHFSKGIYFVRLINSEKQITQKLIVE